MLSEADLDLFRAVSVTDRQVYDIVTTRQLSCAAPYTIFGEYVKRHCIPENDVHSNMSIHGKNNHIYEISVGEHRVQVSCYLYSSSFMWTELGICVGILTSKKKKKTNLLTKIAWEHRYPRSVVVRFFFHMTL